MAIQWYLYKRKCLHSESVKGRMMAFMKKYFMKEKDKTRFYSLDDYDETFAVVKKVSRFGGIRLAHKYTKFSRRCWDTFYWFEIINLALSLVADLGAVKDMYDAGTLNDLTTMFKMLPCFGYVVLAILKSYKMVYNRDVYDNLMTELRGMWPQGEVMEEEHAILRPALTRLHVIVDGYYWCNNLLALSFLAPSYVVLIRIALGASIPRTLPFTFGLPFDQFQPGYHELTLTAQAWQTLLTIWFMICGDLLFCIFLSHITTQFELLSIRIRRFVFVPVDKQLIAEYPLGCISKQLLETDTNIATMNAKQRDAKSQIELGEIIKRHNALIRLSNDVENLFSFALFVNFFYSSVIICFCAFCTVRIEKWDEFMYKFFLITSLSQIWLLCWYGQKLLDSSEGVSSALYSSGWYMASKKIKSSVLIMIVRAQKNVHVTTYGFSIICLASYTTIIKTAWSYFTLLLNTYDP